jgi:hypothetical protein
LEERREHAQAPLLPTLGDLPLEEVRARRVVDLFHKLQTDCERSLAEDLCRG